MTSHNDSSNGSKVDLKNALYQSTDGDQGFKGIWDAVPRYLTLNENRTAHALDGVMHNLQDVKQHGFPDLTLFETHETKLT